MEVGLLVMCNHDLDLLAVSEIYSFCASKQGEAKRSMPLMGSIDQNWPVAILAEKKARSFCSGDSGVVFHLESREQDWHLRQVEEITRNTSPFLPAAAAASTGGAVGTGVQPSSPLPLISFVLKTREMKVEQNLHLWQIGRERPETPGFARSTAARVEP